MKSIPHVSFKLAVPTDSEFALPHGAHLARGLSTALQQFGSVAGTFDAWRGNGWSIPVAVGSRKAEVVFAAYKDAEEEWLLAIVPRTLGFLLRRRERGLEDSETFRIARGIEECLSGRGAINLRWAVNAEPTSLNSVLTVDELAAHLKLEERNEE